MIFNYDVNGTLKDVLNDTKTSIISDPASIDAIKDYDVGIYRVANSDTNIFPNGYGILEILKGSNYCTARFSTINVPNPSTWRIEWNIDGTWYSNVWTDEQKIVKDLTAQLPVANGGTGATSAANARTNLGLCYAANDTESSNSSNPLSGLVSTISNAARVIYLEFVTEKSMENISTVTVTTLTGQLFGVNGVLDNLTSATNLTTGNYTASATKLSNRRVRISITKSSAFTNATALTPVTYWGTVGLKFT